MRDLLRLLTKNEHPWENRSGCSPKISKQVIHSFFWANRSFAHIFAKTSNSFRKPITNSQPWGFAIISKIVFIVKVPMIFGGRTWGFFGIELLKIYLCPILKIAQKCLFSSRQISTSWLKQNKVNYCYVYMYIVQCTVYHGKKVEIMPQ